MESTVELELATSDYTKEKWDKNFLCTFTVSLEDNQVTTKTTVNNKGKKSFDFQAALHLYDPLGGIVLLLLQVKYSIVCL